MQPYLPSDKTINRYSGEFVHAGLERRYQLAVLAETARQLIISLLVAGSMFLLFALVDLGMLGRSARNLYLLGGLRIVVAVAFVLLAVAIRSAPRLAARPLPLNLLLFMFVNAIILVLPLRPETLDYQVISVVALSVALYLFIPNRLPWIVAQNAWLALGFLLTLALWTDRNPAQIAMAALVILLPNVVGYLTALRLNRLQREQFVALEELRQSNLQLQEEIAERERLAVGLRELAQTDALTGLNNRRSFLELAEQALRQARRTGSPLTLCMIDLDHFKAVNDNCGHPAGDLVLVEVAAICREQLRESDLIGRFGGEEFVVALPNTDAYAARLMAERLRARIEQHRFSGDLASLHVTVTAGIAEVDPAEESLDFALQRADEALYEGKREGRNRVALAA